MLWCVELGLFIDLWLVTGVDQGRGDKGVCGVREGVLGKGGLHGFGMAEEQRAGSAMENAVELEEDICSALWKASSDQVRDCEMTND